MAEAASSSETEITVLLVDEQAVTRVGLRAVLEANRDVRIVGECATAGEALDLAATLHPRVAVIDLLAGGTEAFGLIKDLRVRCENVYPLVCSAPLPEHTLRHLFAIGVRGYVRKDERPERLIQAVRRVADGKTYADLDTAAVLLETLSRPRATMQKHADADADPIRWESSQAVSVLLTGAEIEVLHGIGHGQTTADIAAAQHRSPKTIETLRSRIKTKLGLKNTTVLAQLAWQFVHGVGAGGAG